MATEAADKLLSCAVPGTAEAASPSLTLNCSSTGAGHPAAHRFARWVGSPAGQHPRGQLGRADGRRLRRAARGNGETQAHTPPIEFTLSPYSFRSRTTRCCRAATGFGLYLTRIDDIPGIARIMRLSFVWFPKDFRAAARTAVRPRRARTGARRLGAGAAGPLLTVDFDNEPDRPLRDDIRLLGRLLGDTVRNQGRQPLVRRGGKRAAERHRVSRDENVAARRELERILDGLSREQTMIVARAFSYFSHLANLAEDLHNSRRKRQSDIDGDPPADGSLARALDRVTATGAGLETLTGSSATA